MIDFEHISQYHENNRIEAKRALGGLPKSLWETYSAFANTFGGILLLGVEELTDKSFRTVDLPCPEKLVEEFWEIINDRERVSANILDRQAVTVHTIGTDRIISIMVPRADRRNKPVYIGTNPYLGSYRRDGEGDYHCTREEVETMLRDREERTLDEKVLLHMDGSVFDMETVRRYRTYLKDIYAGYEWNQYEDTKLLCRIGAAKKDERGLLHPTAAGLLVFGFEDEIVREYPYFFLDYQERAADGSMAERLVSNSGKWSGNLFDFYLRISGKVVRRLPGDIHRAVREAVANCMINGDYMGSGGLVIIKKKDDLRISNPGGFRIDIRDAVNGGRSDPRNALIARLFNLVKVGSRTGKGVPDIYQVWEKKGWKTPRIKEGFHPDRITLKLPLYGDGRSEPGERFYGKYQEYRDALIDHVTRVVQVEAATVKELLGLNAQEAERLLAQMEEEGILSLMEDGGMYRLKI
ncbi:MAG: putative DNA binding domain-containing protein [Lachnospiraceae bacterium]|nr:putative DNA binding domain-containing protein [Lachnospiraceae bacterium]